MLDVADNVCTFKYLYDQKIILTNPPVIIKVTAVESKNIYYYGAFFRPSLKELFNILRDYMYAKEEYELFNFKETNFKTQINEIY